MLIHNNIGGSVHVSILFEPRTSGVPVAWTTAHVQSRLQQRSGLLGERNALSKDDTLAFPPKILPTNVALQARQEVGRHGVHWSGEQVLRNHDSVRMSNAVMRWVQYFKLLCEDLLWASSNFLAAMVM
eukprot:4916866-Amphidinium_carterae.6